MRRLLLLAAGLGAVGPAPASAAVPIIRVGEIGSDKQCSLYELTSGRHREAGAVNAYGAAYASETSWTSYLVRDCVDHFASLRLSLQAALASAGSVAVATSGGGGYVLSGRISDVSGGGPAAPAEGVPVGGFAVSTSAMTVNMDVTLRDPAGHIVFGGLLTKALETGFSMDAGGMRSESSRSGEALYTELQHQVALATARMVVFHLEPLRVVMNAGDRVTLNYGAPLMALGQLVQVQAADGAAVRYRVISAGQGSAQASPVGDTTHPIQPGALATVIESEDPAANARRFERVDLP